MNNSDVLKVPLIVSVVGHKDITTPEKVLKAYFDLSSVSCKSYFPSSCRQLMTLILRS